MSNKTRWTPGPWRIREMGSEFFVEADGSPDMPYRLDVCGDDYTGHGDDEQRRHNFNLIAAAPEMAELIEAMAHVGIDFGYGEFQLSQEHIDKARAIWERLIAA